MQGHCPIYFKDYFKSNHQIHARATRRSKLLHVPAVRTEIVKRAFYYRGCTIYNELQVKIEFYYIRFFHYVYIVIVSICILLIETSFIVVYTDSFRLI